MSAINGIYRRWIISLSLLLVLASTLCSSFQAGYRLNHVRAMNSRIVSCTIQPSQEISPSDLGDVAIDTADSEDNERGEIHRDEKDSGGIDVNERKPKCYVVISNLQSGSNIGSICRNALAFNVHEVIVIGRKGFRDKMRQADRGAKRRQTFVHFNSISDAAIYLKETRNCAIVGVEIMDSAVSLTSLPFSQSTAFMFGNEGGGLSDRQRSICDAYTYIPQYASGGMASINVACASAVVLQTFAVWANYQETQRVGEKFL